MTTRQALILTAGVVLVAVFLVIAWKDPGCDVYLTDPVMCVMYGGAKGSSWRPPMYILAGVTAAAAVILAFAPWARRKD